MDNRVVRGAAEVSRALVELERDVQDVQEMATPYGWGEMPDSLGALMRWVRRVCRRRGQ